MSECPIARVPECPNARCSSGSDFVLSCGEEVRPCSHRRVFCSVLFAHADVPAAQVTNFQGLGAHLFVGRLPVLPLPRMPQRWEVPQRVPKRDQEAQDLLPGASRITRDRQSSIRLRRHGILRHPTGPELEEHVAEAAARDGATHAREDLLLEALHVHLDQVDLRRVAQRSHHVIDADGLHGRRLAGGAGAGANEVSRAALRGEL
mmetsp:Transcript_19545/g.73992  ORF Transcript_19545/g.73992 Transcript_19545/m.73992 type:complete len:205 (+) Transcript_19545:75-689(+)|eukprot:scaffold1503_cov250-Pinguiococcus_pyrenoidosus.AAC.7